MTQLNKYWTCISIFFFIAYLTCAQRESSKLRPPGKHVAVVDSHAKYYTIRSGISNFYKQLLANNKVTVAFLGGSITFNPGWREKVCNYLKEQYPRVSFHFINAGIPSLGSFPHAFRLQRDVLDSGKIDLLFVEAAVNDRVNGIYGYDSLKQVRSLEGIVRHAKRSNPLMDIIMMSFVDPDKIKDYNTGKIPIEIQNHELVANHYSLPSINLAKEVRDRIANNEFSWEKDFIDLHPSPFGQELYFQTIKALLQACLKGATKHFTSKALPAPLNKASYEYGSYYNVAHAKTDTNWTLNKDWVPTDGLATRSGYVHVPMLIATKPGASFSLNFEGNAIGMAVVSGSDAGIVTYSIDGAPFKNIDLYTSWSSSLHLPWYILFGDDLTNSTHTLQVKISNEKNINSKGNACRIVYFLVNGKNK